MNLLISACNLNGGLYVLDTITRELTTIFEYIDYKGITTNDNYIYAYTNDTKEIVQFDKSFNEIKRIRFTKDAHGMIIYNDVLYVVDSFYDSIARFYSDLTYVDFLSYNPNVNIIDAQHMNDIFILDDLVYICMHNGTPIRNSDTHLSRKSLTDGCVKITNLNTINNLIEYKTLCDNLSQPHSPVIYNNHFFVCDSRRGTVKRYPIINGEINKDEEKISIFKGFTRGLYVDDNYLYVGLSKSNIHNNEDFMELCGISICNLDTMEEIDFIHMPANEIYNIIKLQ